MKYNREGLFMKIAKKKIVSFVVAFVLVLSFTVSAFGAHATISKYPKEKMNKNDIICVKIKGSYLYYHQADWSKNVFKGVDLKWSNVIGYGKLKKIKLSKKTKYKLMNNISRRTCKVVSKKKFNKKIKSFQPNKEVEEGITWYWGMYAHMKVKKGKVKSIIQGFQS